MFRFLSQRRRAQREFERRKLEILQDPNLDPEEKEFEIREEKAKYRKALRGLP